MLEDPATVVIKMRLLGQFYNFYFFHDKISQVQKSSAFYQMSPYSRFSVIYIRIYLPKGNSKKILP